MMESKSNLKLTTTELIARLNPPKGKVSVVFDTDTYNEVDDQFALAFALLSPKNMSIEAVYAAPFFNNRSTGPGDGMEKSYEEILRVFAKLRRSPKGMVFRGSKKFMGHGSQYCDHNDGKPVKSPAALDLISRARKSKLSKPLYVIGIGAPTNIASAILLAPDIINKIVVIWLGGNPHNWHNSREFNCDQDLSASRVLFDSGVPLVQIPCALVAEMLSTTIPELHAHLKGKSEIGDYLCDIVEQYSDDHFAWSKVVWDISAPAWLINSQWLSSSIVHSPILTDQFTLSFDSRRHFMRVITHINRDGIYRDLFTKLAKAK
jgi:inosine-uridine nucleoside N-ribohydrolase